MDTVIRVKNVLRDGLSLGARADRLTVDSPLLGSVPELDSMAVVQIITMLESEFGITIDDDELSADLFATVGSLARFVSEKTAV
jgi:acyl carrier protein